jgi:hypothetical protein
MIDSIGVDKYMHLIEPLTIEVKLELLAKLSENVRNSLTKKNVSDKQKLLNSLSGAWSDISDIEVNEILNGKVVVEKEINLE